MKQKILFNLTILNRNYCVFFNENNTNMSAFACNKNGENYFVNDEKEIRFLNKIVDMLNKKYVRRRDIFFNNEKFARYENRYNHMSYFGKIEENDIKMCHYEEYKDLYKLYNGIQIDYNRTRNSSFNTTPSYDDFDMQPFGGSYNYYDNYSNSYQNSNPNNYYKAPRKNNIAKKIVLAISGVAVVVTLSLAGYKLLSSKNLPEIISKNTPLIEQEFGEVDIVADTEEEKALQDKYSQIQTQLESVGLENWEISAELDTISVFQEDSDNIEFYYDAEKNEVVYVYEELPERIESNTQNVESTTVSENVQKIIDAINQNDKLSQDEKKYIIETYRDTWIENEEYLNIDELVSRYSILEIEYDFVEGGKELHTLFNPATKADGSYTYSRTDFDGVEYSISKMNIYDSNSLEETLGAENKKSTFNHEANHINGNFGFTLLNEGYNQLSQTNCDERYKTEQAMNMLFIETFGNDAIKEGFYGFDLQTALTNKVVETTGKDAKIVDEEVYNLLADAESLLYDIAEDENYKNNSESIERYESIFNRLSIYYQEINGREMKENQITNAVKDYLIGTRTCSLYSKDSESIKNIYYDVKSGTFNCEFTNEHDDNITYEVGMYIHTVSSDSRRIVSLDNTNKYDSTYKIKDEDIGYLTR